MVDSASAVALVRDVQKAAAAGTGLALVAATVNEPAGGQASEWSTTQPPALRSCNLQTEACLASFCSAHIMALLTQERAKVRHIATMWQADCWCGVDGPIGYLDVDQESLRRLPCAQCTTH